MATHILADTVEFSFVQACGVIPLVGTTVAAIAQSIIDLAAKADHNRTACKYISERVKINLKIIASVKDSQGRDVEKSKEDLQKTYEEVLTNIKTYMVEINKPGKFTEKVKKWLVETANANDIAAATEILLKQLTDATEDFYKSVTIDTNSKVTQIQEEMSEGFAATTQIMDQGFAALQIMITQKGEDKVADEDIEKLKLNPALIEDDDDDNDENENRKNIKKRLYIGNVVAVKKLVDNPDLQLKKIAKQARIISLLSACDHIEKFFGTYEENMEGNVYLFVVTKWMEKGNLQDYLANNKSISWPEKYTIAHQIALGLEFCKGAEVYHRDVRSKNVLLNERLNAKLTNFDMSRRIGDKSSEMPLEALRWTAPEKLKYPKQPYTDKCEVYSFAILLWEISTHKIPFSDIENPIKASEKAKAEERPSPFSDGTPGQYKDIVENAWNHNPKKRPDIDEVRKQLWKIMKGGKRVKPMRSDTSFSMEDSLKDAPLHNIKKVISLHDNKQYKEAFPHFLRLAREGDATASYYAGLYLFKGTYEGIEKDEIQALQLFQKSADGGNVEGMYMYAYACLKGTYYSKDEGIKSLKKAAIIKKHPEALYMVSQLFLNGDQDYPVNHGKYMEYLKMAAERGSEVAKKELEVVSIDF